MQQFGKILGGKGGGQAALIQAVIGMVSSGGLNGLLGKFQSAGMEKETRSWVSNQESNEQISGSQVRQALGDEEVDRLAGAAGISPDEAADGLAGVIPQTVDQLTPDGQVQEGNTLQERLGGLRGMIPGL